jgi:glycosyltransferase involved in cell wall biosynthesis
MITELGVGERVHLVGERHGRRLQESVSSADLFALTSRWEGLPMVLLEALALARPAVVSPAVERVTGVAAAGAGWVADDSGLGSILRQIQAMGRDELATRGRAALLLSRRYDWNGVAERYEAAYERARGPRQRVAP